MSSGTNSSSQKKSVTIDGTPYYANMHVTYVVTATKCVPGSSLVDRGANGGICGDDVRIIDSGSNQRTVNIQGIDNHTILNVPIVSAGGVVMTQHGLVIVIMHQYASVGKGTSIHSAGQLKHFGNDVNDKSVKVEGGTQRILTLDGYILPLDIKNGLPYLRMRPYTDKE